MNTLPPTPMDCAEVQEWLPDYATPVPGDDVLTPEQRQGVDSHLKGCSACQKELTELEATIGCLKSLQGIEVPDDSLNRVTNFAKIFESQSHAAPEAGLEGQPSKNHGIRGGRLVGWAAIGAVAAGFLFVLLPQVSSEGMRSMPPSHGDATKPAQAIGAIHDSNSKLPGSPPAEIVTSVEASSTPLPVSADAPIDSIDSPVLALQWLRDAMGEDQSGGSVRSLDEWRHCLALLGQINERWPDSPESFTSLMMQSRCWEALGEAAKSREVFLQYADSESGRIRQRVLAAGATPEEAFQLFQQALAKRMKPELLRMFSEGNVLGATAYADALLTRYGGEDGEVRSLVQYTYGRAYHGTKQFSEVIRTYEELAASGSGEAWRRELLPYYRTALQNTRQGAKAAMLWQEEFERATDRESKAICLLNKAAALTPPPGDIGSALRAYRQVQTEYPETASAVHAARHLAMLRQRTLGSILN